jgi:hypothetical protein
LRTEIAEDFIQGMKTLFKEHFIEVPEEKYDVLDELQAKSEGLQSELDESITQRIELAKELNALKASTILDEQTKDLAATEAEKLKKLVEGVDFDSEDLYREKVSVIKENYFPKTPKQSPEKMLVEESGTNPLSSYAATKLKSEKHILAKGGTIFRLGTVFGLGDTYSRLRMDLVVNVLTMKAIKYGEITINGGEQWRPIIAVKDIAEYITEAAQFKYEGVYILSKENVIIKELGEKIAKMISGTKIKYTEISFQDARNYRVDNSKSLSTFKYKPEVTVEDEVSKMIKIFSEERIQNLEDEVYHNGLFLKNKKIKNELV